MRQTTSGDAESGLCATRAPPEGGAPETDCRRLISAVCYLVTNLPVFTSEYPVKAIFVQAPVAAMTFTGTIVVCPTPRPLVILLVNVARIGVTPVLLVVLVVVDKVDVLPLLHLTVEMSGFVEGVSNVVQLPEYLLVPVMAPLVMPPPVHPVILRLDVEVELTFVLLPIFGNAGLYFTVPVSFVHVGNVTAAAPAEPADKTPTGMSSDNASNSPAALRIRTPSLGPPRVSPFVQATDRDDNY